MISSLSMSQMQLILVPISVKIYCDFFKLHHRFVNLLLVSITCLKRVSRSLNVLGVSIKCGQSLIDETTEHIYFLLVLGDLASVLVLIKLKIQSVFFEDLEGRLSRQVVKGFIDFAFCVSKDFEFLTFY